MHIELNLTEDLEISKGALMSKACIIVTKVTHVPGTYIDMVRPEYDPKKLAPGTSPPDEVPVETLNIGMVQYGIFLNKTATGLKDCPPMYTGHLKFSYDKDSDEDIYDAAYKTILAEDRFNKGVMVY